ncbi:MAG: RNB domain-containing ribonuclease [Opitutaceae bacterium]|nr:RNB domain-containing ribonuclease [Opitutaceae bacterium]
MQLRERLLALLREPRYRPADEVGLFHLLRLHKKQRASLDHELRRLLAAGQIVRTPRGQYKPAQNADEVTGRILFRAGGSAFVIPDDAHGNDPDQPTIQISPNETYVALHGDSVAVRVLHGVRTRRPGEVAGQVVRVIERARDTLVGHLTKAGRNWVVVPDDPRFVHEVLVPDPARSKLKPRPAAGDKVVVQLHEWRHPQDALSGEISTRLGRTHEPRAELLGIFEKYGLDPQFPDVVQHEVAKLPDRVQPREMVGRLDYRNVPTFTIDPDDAKDFDDAISIERLDHDEIRVGVHIADVSAYVKPGTALDREAQRRGNSTYLVGTVIPMLPEKLSNGLCSLVEGENRLTKAVFLTFGKNGRLKDKAYANTVIRSRKRLTYKQAYAFLFENDLDKIRNLPLPPSHQTGSTGRALRELPDTELVDLQSWVRQLWRLASRLRQERMAHGSLDLDMPETKIFVDKEGYADRLERIENDESHQLIEEFMLAANEAVAHLTRVHRLASLYRVHDDPDEEKLGELRQLLGTFEIQTGDLTRRPEVVKLLKTLSDHPQGYTLRTQLLRSLRKACYRASPDGHYGLNKKDYTHFTSPIRRYSDLVVHRVFDHYLIKHAGYPAHPDKNTGYHISRVESLGEHLTLTEVNSQEAERESVKIKLLEFFEREVEKTPKTVFAAIITDVRPNGFFIELVDSMTFGLVPASSLRDDHYQANQAGTALIGRRRKRRFGLNDRLDVVVHKVDRFKRLIDFRPAQ